MKLVIVESPTKTHTLKRYLGDDYDVVASIGHIRDLAIKGKNGYGVDIENGFIPIIDTFFGIVTVVRRPFSLKA